MGIDDAAIKEEHRRAESIVFMAELLNRLKLSNTVIMAEVFCGDNMNSHLLSVTSDGRIWATHNFDMKGPNKHNKIYTELQGIPLESDCF
jgi:hypothetical protein